MERTGQVAETSDRALREALEDVQMELRQTRAALQTAAVDAQRSEAALRSAVEQARGQRDAAAARVKALEQERVALEAELPRLDERLAAQRKEAEVLARGARLREQYVDWNPGDARYAVRDGMTGREVAWSIGLTVAFIVLVTVLLFATR